MRRGKAKLKKGPKKDMDSSGVTRPPLALHRSGRTDGATGVDRRRVPCKTPPPTDLSRHGEITFPPPTIQDTREIASKIATSPCRSLPVRSITVILGTHHNGCHYEPLLRAIDQDPQLKLDLIVCGERTSPELDTRCCVVVSQGFRVRRRVELPRAVNTTSGMVTLPTHQRVAFAEALHAEPTDLVLLLGKPEEMLAAAQAARTARVPIAYLHNNAIVDVDTVDADIVGADGEHAFHQELINICHHHFVTNEQDQQTLLERGEASWRITTTGSLLLDELRNCPPLRPDELTWRLGVPLEERPLVVTFQPDGSDAAEDSQQLRNLLDAVEIVDMPTIFAYAEGTRVGPETLDTIRSFTETNRQAHLASRCDWPTYWSLLREATALVSNGSAGMVEAGWLNIPLVSIDKAEHEDGCPQVDGVVNAGYERYEIFAAIATVTAKEFPDLYEHPPSPYGDGTSAQAMVARLKSLVIDEQLLQKTSRPAAAMTSAAELEMAVPQPS